MILRLFARYRRTVVLGGALLLSFLLMTMEVRREENLVPFLKRLLLESVSPFLKASTYVKHGIAEIWGNYVDLRVVRQENLRLQEEIQALQARLRVLEEERGESQRLKTLLGLRERQSFTYIPARVVGKDATNWFHSLVIDQGASDGIERHMAVIAPEGLVGQVVEVTRSSARVQLITDPVSAVGALLQTSRVTGLLVGAQPRRLRVKYLPVRAEVRSGEGVITSGLGGVYPKGILIGRVVAVDKRSGALFQEATVGPSVDFSRLEEVLVVAGERLQTSPSQRRGP
ncbi:MAG: rod shape-determining protein MreC [Candidatus Methylomirabilales bacterium]